MSQADLLAKVRQDKEKVRAELARLDTVEQWLVANTTGHSIEVTLSPTDNITVAKPANGKVRMVDVAAEVIRKAGRSLTTREVADAVLAAGYETKNPDGFRNAVFSGLSRSADLFEKDEAGLWRLKGVK
jgi:hypothetical protein